MSASLLKQWLRELEEPIIPKHLYQRCLDVSSDAQACVDLVTAELPPLHLATLEYLVQFLQYITQPEHQQVTRMTVDNVAMVFVPNILRSNATDPLSALKNAAKEQHFCRNLLLLMKPADDEYEQ